MKIYNAGTTTVLVSDILVDGYPLQWDPLETKTLFDEDVERSAQLKAFVAATTLTVTGAEEPSTGVMEEFSYGTLATPIAKAFGASTTVMCVNLANTADIAAGGTIFPAYLKCGNTVATQPNTQFVALNLRTALNADGASAVIDSAYGLQAHVQVKAAIATAVAIADITAVSGKVAIDFNVTKGWVRAGSFLIEGNGTLTEQSSCVEAAAQAGADVRDLICAYADGTSTAVNGLNLSGAITNDIVLSKGVYITSTSTTVILHAGVKTATFNLTAGTLAFA